jgi:predicted metal-dependent peptidase
VSENQRTPEEQSLYEAKVEEAKVAIQKSIFDLIFTFRFFGSLASRLIIKVLPDYEKTRSMMTDSRFLWYDAEFTLDLTVPERNFVVAHETIHAAMGHCDPKRRGNRTAQVMTPDGELHDLWGFAIDYTTNGILMMAIRENSNYSRKFAMPKCGLYRKDLEGNSAERNYDILLKEAKANGNKVTYMAGSSHAGIDNAGSRLPTLEPHEVSVIQDQWKNAVEQALGAERMRNQGSLPGYLQKFSEIFHVPPEIPWEDLLDEEITSLYKSKHRFNPPNKRFMHLGICEPSVCGSHIKGKIYVDTSGSFLDFLPKIFGHLSHIFSRFESYEIEIIEIDAAIAGRATYVTGEDFSSHPPKVSGGGGTSFIPAFKDFEYSMQTGDSDSDSILIYITDGYGTFPEEPDGYKTVWIVPRGEKDPSLFPFGTVIQVS